MPVSKQSSTLHFRIRKILQMSHFFKPSECLTVPLFILYLDVITRSNFELFLIFEYLDCCVKIKKMSDWDTTTYLTKSHAKKGSSNEKTQVRQAQRAGTLETRQKMFAGTNNKGNTAHHAKLDRETEELKHKVSMKSTIFG